MSYVPLRSRVTRMLKALYAVVVFVLTAAPSSLLAETFTRDVTTYLGGDSTDRLSAVLDGGDGHVYVTGVTRSTEFLGLPTNDNGFALFALKIDPSGNGSVVAKNLVTASPTGANLLGAGALSATQLYLLAFTNDSDFLQNVPTGSAYDDTFNGERDIVVVSLDRNTLAPVAGTYLGGSGNEFAADALTVGPDGRVYVLGRTQTPPGAPIEFPTTPGAYDETVNCSMNGQCDVDFTVSVFSADLSTLEYSTVFGGTDIDYGGSTGTITVDTAGRIIFTGSTASKNFPVTDGSALDGREDGVLVILDPQGNGSADLVRSAYIGGRSSDAGLAVELDGSGAIWLAGRTASTDFPGASGWMGQDDGFLSRIVESGTGGYTVEWTTLIGGSSADAIGDVAINPAGALFVSGVTRSADFPASPDADDSSQNGGEDAFLAKIDTNGAVVYATLLGGSKDEGGSAIALSSATAVHIGGKTNSSNLPTTPGAIQETYGGIDTDGFLASYSAAPPAVCGDGMCDPGEDPCSCSADCGVPPLTETLCADGADDDCDGLLDCDDPDCGGDAACLDPCGDGICDTASGEDSCSCALDCGAPPTVETDCSNGTDDDCDGDVDCADLDCAGDPSCPSCAPKNAPCDSDNDCCSGNCNQSGKCVGGPQNLTRDSAFVRGDANSDDTVDLADVLTTLGRLFLGAREPACLDAADANDDGAIDISDAILTLAHLFLGAGPLPEPWPERGDDPTEDFLDCAR